MVAGSTERLDRRLKRRVVSNQICDNFFRKIGKKDEVEEIDVEYQKFLNNIPEFVDCTDENVEAKIEDFGNCNDHDGTSWSDKKVDPVYKMFFQHLTEEGKAYKLEIPSVNGMKVYVKYEEQEQEQEQSSLKNDQNRKNPGTTRILSSRPKKKEIDSPAKESLVPLFQEEFSLECAKAISHGVNGNSSTMPNTGLLQSAKHFSQSDSDSDMMDEDYKTYLTDVLYDGERLIYMPVDGRSFVCEDEDHESTSDSEVVMMDTDPCKPNRASFGRKYFRPTMDIDSGKCFQSPGTCRSSDFKERLIKVLQKPYDQHEYDFFLEEVSRRRAHVRHRELRSGVLKAYTLESCGKSYLHIYSELATKIQSVQYDRPRTLNILRGFFYWLQNLSHEDAFQPWMDPSFLDVLPWS